MSTSGVRRRRGPRIVVAVGLVLCVSGLFAALVAQLRTGVEADSGFVAAERQGVAYLRPLTRLMVDLGSAGSAAVRGQAATDTDLKTAVAAVADVDARIGDDLGTRRHWADLAAAIDKVVAERPTGRTALDRYTDLVTLATELSRMVGDTSNLILDPELASFYLTDTALLELPAVLTAGGQAADLNYLAAKAQAAGRDGKVDTAAMIDVSVARTQVAAGTAAISDGLRKAMGATTRSAIDSNSINEQLDTFRSAVDQMASPAALRQSAAPSGADSLQTAGQQVRQAGLSLAVTVLSELDNLLADRERALRTQQIEMLATAAAGVVLAVVLLWWSVPAPARGQLADQGDSDGSAHPQDVASVSVQMPAVDARDLLALEELVHVGRGVRARPRGEVDDAR